VLTGERVGVIGSATDEVLARRAAAGQHEAFDELVRRHRTRVHALALRICRNADDAEDALQETFISAYRALPTFGSRARVSTWLYRIATNKCYDVLARRRPTADADGLPEPADPRDPFAHSERRQLLARALDALPGQFREAALLCDVCGLTPAEAGEVAGVPEGTMKSRSFRARALLAAALRADGAEPVTESGV
jgi:RNA polymerase sigma-70 factor, ECF subfamily